MGSRIAIIGNACGGKSTMAKLLAAAKQLPLYRLDALQWNPGWKATPQDEFDRRHNELLERDQWIIDGYASWESIERRFEAADTIILVDHSLWVHYWWAMKRQFMCLFRPRPDFVEDCPMLPMTGKLLRMIWNLHWQARPRLIDLVNMRRDEKWVYDINSPHELREFIAGHCSIAENEESQPTH